MSNRVLLAEKAAKWMFTAGTYNLNDQLDHFSESPHCWSLIELQKQSAGGRTVVLQINVSFHSLNV